MAASHGQANENGTRMSALWGTGGKRGEGSRNSVLWGKGGRNASLMLVLTAAVAMLLPWGAAAHSAGHPLNPGSGSSLVYIPSTLLSQAQANPQTTFNVIVQGDGSKGADRIARQVADFSARANTTLVSAANNADANYQNAENNATNWDQKARGPHASRKDHQQAAAAQAAAAQAAATDNAANGAIGQLSDRILQQQVSNEFSSITGVSATLTGAQIVNLVNNGHGGLLSITPDAPVAASDFGAQQGQAFAPLNWSSTQLWPYESQSAQTWNRDKDPSFVSNMPSIAIVDSGVQSRADFGSRLIASVNLSSLPNNTSTDDGRGHGTFVAGIAADGLPGVTGADPAANIVSVKVLDSTGMGLTSDIINSCQWILNHKTQYNIKVVNFSLHSGITAPFYIDPLDRAVESLWFNGITVVAAAGNYGTATGPSGVLFSPGDDPFVITVGAADINSSTNPKKATIAPWSAWGYTVDGFAKPEVSAPGRYMIGPVPTTSTLVSERPANVTSPGYMQLSGTSFSAPVVSGAAANILAAHPSWTPDQVKGALMVTAASLASGVGAAGGVGVIQARAALRGANGNAPNPNAALEQFVATSTNAAGNLSVSFDAASWNSAAQANASWNSASWNDASWNSASWNSVSWNSVSWNSASWNDASWNDASWNDASWNDAALEDAAEGDSTTDPAALVLSPDDVAALLADPTFDPTTLPPGLLPVTPTPVATTTTPTTTTTPATTPAAATTTTPAATTTTPAATTTTAAITPAPAPAPASAPAPTPPAPATP